MIKVIMNYKLEKFWNNNGVLLELIKGLMNYKLEKFWNYLMGCDIYRIKEMNYKLEKFWNASNLNIDLSTTSWTINLKSFEIT